MKRNNALHFFFYLDVSNERGKKQDYIKGKGNEGLQFYILSKIFSYYTNRYKPLRLTILRSDLIKICRERNMASHFKHFIVFIRKRKTKGLTERKYL